MTAATKYCDLLTLHWKMQVMGPLWQLRRVVQRESTLKIANSMQPLDSIFSLCIQGRANCVHSLSLWEEARSVSDPGP